MSTLTPRETFRQLVAEIAAKAKDKLPQAVNGRVESAVKLVLAHDVVFHEDGTVEVGSASDPLKTYTLAGHACDCQDFAYGKAPEGWCQHRIAAGIAKRVQEVLPQAPPVETAPGLPTSAPTPAASTAADSAAPRERSGMRLEAQVVIDGRPVKVALWGPDDADVQARLAAVLVQYPVQAPTSPQGQPPQGQGETPQCPTHGALKKSTKGKGWYCPAKNADGTWCNRRH